MPLSSSIAGTNSAAASRSIDDEGDGESWEVAWFIAPLKLIGGYLIRWLRHHHEPALGVMMKAVCIGMCARCSD